MIERPIDLSEIKDRLDGNKYANPTELAKDMKLMFNNSRIYNTNKRSKVH